MAFISATRLRVCSALYQPQFYWYVFRTSRQAKRAPGFRGGKLLGEAKRIFWTMTAWETEAAMHEYRNSSAHRRAMPKLLDWCDEASIAHWHQESLELPNWQEAYRRMVAEGRMSKVKHPSPAQVAKQIAEPKVGERNGITLTPAQAQS